MKVADRQYNKVIGSEAEKEYSFGIDTSQPFMFELLREKIYTDPISAICREVSDNCRDAHKEAEIAGKPPKRPVEITVPGEYLVFRDFGLGISPDRMENIFVKYGNSSKRESNAEGGGFGLGAKTPFAYTDSFTIETVYGNTLYEYLAYIDESGIGKVELLNQEKTNRHSGTSIKIPVKSQDRELFTQKIVHYTGYWDATGDQLPKLRGMINHESKINYKFEDYILIKEKDTKKFNILVNGIPYFLNRFDYPALDKLVHTIIPTFETGELYLNPNRENIILNEHNQVVVERKITSIVSNIIEHIETVIQKCSSQLEVDNFIRDSNFSNYMEGRRFYWKGQEIYYPFNYDLDAYLYNSGYGSNTLCHIKHAYLNLSRLKEWNENVYIIETDIEPNTVYGSPELHINSYMKGKIRRYIESLDNRYGLIFLLPKGVSTPTIYGIKPPNIKYSDIKIPKKQLIGCKRDYVVKYNTNFETLKRIQLSDTTPYVYITKKEVDELRSKNALTHLLTKVVIIADGNVSKVKDLANWTHIRDYLRGKQFDVKEVERYFVAQKMSSSNGLLASSIFDIEYDCPFDENSEWGILAYHFGILKLREENIDVSMYNRDYLEKKYPLMELISYADIRHNHTIKNLAKEYVEFINSI